MDDGLRVILTLLERICTASGHRIPALCAYMARHDAWARLNAYESDEHRRLRAKYLGAMNDLPFVAEPPMLEEHSLALERRVERPREAHGILAP